MASSAVSKPGTGTVKTINSEAPDSSGNAAISAADVGAEPTQTAASQAEAEAGSGTSVRSWTPQRIWQAIAAWGTTVTSIFGGILRGARGALVASTPADGATVTINYLLTDCLSLDLANITTGKSVTLAFSNVPSSSYFSAVTVSLKAAASVGTITWPSGSSGQTAPTANKTAIYSGVSVNGGTNWLWSKMGEY